MKIGRGGNLRLRIGGGGSMCVLIPLNAAKIELAESAMQIPKQGFPGQNANKSQQLNDTFWEQALAACCCQVVVLMGILHPLSSTI